MPGEQDLRPTRRRYLQGVGTVAGAVGVVGCTSGGTETPGDGSGTATETDPGSRTGTPIHPDYETVAVRVEAEDGSVLGQVTAAIADTPDLRYTGLSDTDELPGDRGMLFVYGTVADRTFVMRRMDFGIDIVYAGADGRITTIHHAPAPGPDEDGSQQEYPGRGQYVLEVFYGWTSDHGVSPGDRLVFDL